MKTYLERSAPDHRRSHCLRNRGRSRVAGTQAKPPAAPPGLDADVDPRPRGLRGARRRTRDRQGRAGRGREGLRRPEAGRARRRWTRGRASASRRTPRCSPRRRSACWSRKASWSGTRRSSATCPWFPMYDPYVTRELTIRDLLVHRSGLGLGAGDLLWWPRVDLRPQGDRAAAALHPARRPASAAPTRTTTCCTSWPAR